MAISEINDKSLAASAVNLATNTVTGVLPAANTVANLSPGNNIVINGAMQVAQRSTSVAISSDGYHTLDRWRTAISSLGSWTQTKSTDVPTGAGFASSLKMDCTTADASPAAGDYLQVSTRIEGQDVQRLKYGTASAESMILSFWVKSTKTGVNVVSFYQDDGAKQISGSYTIGTSNTWEYKTIAFVGNTVNAIANDNTRGFQVAWYLGAGSNRTSGTLRTAWTAYATADEAVGQVNNADSTSNDWLITGVQLEVGTVATPFNHRSYGQELQLCKRYFQKIGNRVGICSGSTTITAIGPYPVSLRAAPTVGQTGVLNAQNGSNRNVTQSSTGLGTNYGTNESMFQVAIPNFTGLTAPEAINISTPANNNNLFTLDAEL